MRWQPTFLRFLNAAVWHDPQVVGSYAYLGFGDNTRFEVVDLRTGQIEHDQGYFPAYELSRRLALTVARRPETA